jgi:hypothetical protein
MTSIPWQRLAAESIAIVAGILLAFAIDAWWEEQGRIVEEIESLGLIHRDLTDTVEQLAGYRDFAEVGAHAAIDAYGAITGPGPYDAEVIRDDMLLVDRRTVVIPRAAYTDLLSTGNLRVIKDRVLRDELIRFYESAARMERVIQKNNDWVLDGMVGNNYFAKGLLIPRYGREWHQPFVNNLGELLKERLGPDFAHPSDPFWNLASDSEEWRVMRSSLLWAAQIHLIGVFYAERMIDDASRLAAQIQQEVDAR